MLWESRVRRKSQARVALQRTGLNCAAYIDEMAGSGISPRVATALYEQLLPYCSKGVLPHPDDGLFGFYLSYADDLEDLLPGVFGALDLPLPPVTDSDFATQLESVRHLAAYLQSQLEAR